MVSGAGTDALVFVFFASAEKLAALLPAAKKPTALLPAAEILSHVFELDRVQQLCLRIVSGAGTDALVFVFFALVPVSPLDVATSLSIAQALSLKRGPIALTPLPPRGVWRFPFSQAVALGAEDIC